MTLWNRIKQAMRNLMAGRRPEIQLIVDATAMSQAGIGAGQDPHLACLLLLAQAVFSARRHQGSPQTLAVVVGVAAHPHAGIAVCRSLLGRTQGVGVVLIHPPQLLPQ